jgi:hypothetical protein
MSARKTTNPGFRSDTDDAQDCFKKYLSPEKFQNEWEMSTAAYKISIKTGLFVSPIIKKVLPEENIIEFELLRDFIPVRVVFIKNGKFGASYEQLGFLKKLFYRIGKCVYQIHTESQIFKEIPKRTFPKGFFSDRFKDTPVFLHGDFTLNNLLYKMQTDEIVIIDWNTSPIFPFSANYGPRYWDLSFFISSLFYSSFSTFFSYGLRKKLALEFLNGYSSENEHNSKALFKELQQFMKSYNYYKLYRQHYKSNLSFSRRVLVSHTKVKLNRFLEDDLVYTSK